ncbi:MAG: tRNA (adenosine(37)-N6)-threonylcarbamoyltransferase complex ATPase subunit type 1 TsaE [Lachnospiraceae bacterium]|nr:tRNA (adenosine(37)-N6)-threonylcarbamoyltransferase complex ATPase subunit type 1 TsaE [Lachnospiraceae bacterium]
MKSKEIMESFSEEETFQFGMRIGESAKEKDVFALLGDLGVGKTVFIKGVAAGLGIKEPVNSPTFTIVQVYEGGRLPFYHFDVYRIGDVEEMDEIGYEDCFYGTGVSFVEWANLIEEIMPEYTTWITMEKDLKKGFDYRRITIEKERESGRP